MNEPASPRAPEDRPEPLRVTLLWFAVFVLGALALVSFSAWLIRLVVYG